MSDIRSLHYNALRVKPKNQVTKPSTFWVAVLRADKKPTGKNDEHDFLWVKSPGRITAQIIRNQYEKACEIDEPIVLKHEAQPVNPQTTVAELDVYHDQVVVFEAIKASDTARLPRRQPLQPTNPQVLSSPNIKQSPPIEDIKTRFPVSRSQTPNTQDENRETQQKLHPLHTHSRGHDSTANHSPHVNISSFRTSDKPSPAPHTGTRDPAGKVPSPATYSLSSVTQSFLPASSSDILSRVSAPNAIDYPSSTNLDPTDLSFKGFDQFCQAEGDRFRIFYPNDSADEVQDRLVQSWKGLPSPERTTYAEQARPSQISSDMKSEQNADVDIQDIPAADEPPMPSAELEDQQQNSFQLQTILKDASPQMLESSVEQGVKLLERLRAPLIEKMQDGPDAEQWIQQIGNPDNLRKQAVRTKTVIGVVGNTGAGKSSVINAMLDEERLVPTNCMRACTAVVTEISYNYEEEPYRAQIEFISLAEWEKELKVLFQDLLDGNGQVSRECANEDTDAGIAYAKIKAVYPRKTKEDIAKSNIDSMLREVSHVLGNSRDIKETDPLRFYRKLQQFVDSKEKSTGPKDKNGKKERKEMEFWPLIRVVRIYVKSPALATGAVIVDLPGVHDANAARAAVAEGYMKQCTGLWIVAPINRAVDDKAAKSLLGESFKRQLKMDGGFNSVTFICSKTDDISLEEAQDSLGLDEEMAPCWAEIDELAKKQKSMKQELEELKETKAVYGEAVNDVDEQLEQWEALKDKLEEGETVFAPKPKAATKRKIGRKDKPRKKQRRTVTSDDEVSEYTDSDDQKSDSGQEEHDDAVSEHETREPLTEDQIGAKMQELRTLKKEARGHKMDITEKIAALRDMIKEAEEAEERITSKLSAKCISGRNEYSKGAIQQDFAAGIKELDQELAAEEDEENFNPDAEVRDYEEVARGLPVFCVSARGYQKLKGRFRKDPDVPGFTNIDQTEIPALQAHCEKLTETGRSANCRSFITKLNQLLNSLTLWASSDGTGANMTTEQKAKEAKYLQKGLKALESGLEKAVETACKELVDEFTDNIFDKYETAISNATKDAIDTALKWGAPVNRENRAAGGLHWATYKAICRRNGIYSNAQGPHEWNTALAEPMLKILASGWEKTFTRRSPMVMANFVRNSASVLKNFHRDIEARARKIGAGIAGLSMLQQQVSVYENILKDLSSTAKEKINTAQKEINREFIPVIEHAMTTAYERCVNENGTGSFARMKAAMNSHVAQERHVMFQHSADNVRNLLVNMAKDIEKLMNDKADEVFVCMKRDYRAVLGGGDLQQNGELLPRNHRMVRKEIRRIIDGVEKIFMEIVGLKVEENDERAEGEEGEMDDESDHEGDDTAKEEGSRKEGNSPVKEETSLSSQLAEDEDVPRPTTSPSEQGAGTDESMADASSPDETEQVPQGSNDRATAKVEEDSNMSDAIDSPAASESESD